MADSDTPNGSGRDANLEALRRKVEAARGARTSDANRETPKPAALAVRFGGEFGAAVLVGAGLGYGVDFWARTGPWGLVIGLTLGFVTGIVNVVRAAGAYARDNPVDPNARSVPDDADE